MAKGKKDGRNVIVPNDKNSIDKIPSPPKTKAPRPKIWSPKIKGVGRNIKIPKK